jgi:hypothetical protein
MFLWVENENRIKRRIRWICYMLKNVYFWKFRRELKRIKIEGYCLSFPLGLAVNFRILSKKEYYEKTHVSLPI